MFYKLILHSHHQSQVNKLSLFTVLQQLAQFLAQNSLTLLFLALQAKHNVRVDLCALKLSKTFDYYPILLFHFSNKLTKSNSVR